jgi:hypothetical protein
MDDIQFMLKTVSAAAVPAPMPALAAAAASPAATPAAFGAAAAAHSPSPSPSPRPPPSPPPPRPPPPRPPPRQHGAPHRPPHPPPSPHPPPHPPPSPPPPSPPPSLTFLPPIDPLNPPVFSSFALAVGHNYTCTLTRRGMVQCFGVNSRGQLGMGHASEYGALGTRHLDLGTTRIGRDAPLGGLLMPVKIRYISAGFDHA